MNMFCKYPQLYSVIIPAISVPMLLGITFIIMGIEITITTK